SAARVAAALSSGFVHLGLRHILGIERPGILARSRSTCAVHVRTAGPAARHFGGARSLDAPFLDPRGHLHAGLPRRGALGISTAAVMRLHSCQV
ncbi:hypothetical protein M9458_043302, partial [Cirrhinus mrigala]